MLLLGGFLEDGRHGSTQLVEGAVATEATLLAGGIGEREIKSLPPTLAKAASISSAAALPRASLFGDGSLCFSLMLAA